MLGASFGAGAVADVATRVMISREAPPVVRRIGMADVQALAGHVQALRTWEGSSGGAAARHSVEGALRGALTLRNASAGPAVRARLAATIGDLAELAAWSAGDAGQYARARQLFALSLSAVRESDDAGMLASVTSDFARLAVESDDPATAVTLVGLAGSCLHSRNGPAAAKLLALQAKATARQPDGAGQTLRLIGRAEETYHAGDHNYPTEPYLAAQLGTDLAAALLDLSAHVPAQSVKPALARLNTTIHGYPPNRVRGRAVATTRLANALYLAREPEEASRHALAALDAAGTVRSALLSTQLRQTRQLARRYPALPAAAQVRHGVTRALAWMS